MAAESGRRRSGLHSETPPAANSYEGRRHAGVHVASRRVALRGSSRTVFREGSGLRPGDIEHTDREQNLIGGEHVPDYVSRHTTGPVCGSKEKTFAVRGSAQNGASSCLCRRMSPAGSGCRSSAERPGDAVGDAARGRAGGAALGGEVQPVAHRCEGEGGARLVRIVALCWYGSGWATGDEGTMGVPEVRSYLCQPQPDPYLRTAR
jgi:hypothetical protein